MKIRAYHNIKLLRLTQTIAWLSLPFVLLVPSTFNLYMFLIGIVLITSIGSSAGLHRYFGHRSFTTGKIRHWVLAFLTTLSTQGSIALWVSFHREHHKNSDTEHDLISPSFVGFWKAFFAIQDVNGYNN